MADAREPSCRFAPKHGQHVRVQGKDAPDWCIYCLCDMPAPTQEPPSRSEAGA